MFIKIVFIYLFLFLIESVLNYVVIEFKTHHSVNNKENNETNYNSTDFLKDYYLNKIFFPIEVGSPPKEVPFILITSTSGLNIGYSICSLFYFSDLPQEYFEYSVDSSTTYNLTSSYMKVISNTFSGSPSTELFKFGSNIDIKKSKQIKVNDLPFIYISKDDAIKIYNDGKICGLLGLTLYEDESFLERYNLISMLKRYNIVDNYVFNYEFNENNSDEGMLIIGEEPHNYNPKKYNKEQLISDYASGEHYSVVWGFMFSSIYFFNEENNKITVNEIKYAQLLPELYCIKGTSYYKKHIEENFFNYYINKNICRFDIESIKISNKNSNSYYIMNCDINSEFKIEKFPTIYFSHAKYNYTFELDYNDLFIKKGNKYFFMVIFPYSYIEHFEMGKIFLKKYFFSYDLDKKTISFYNKNIPVQEKAKKDKESFSIYLIIGGIVFLIISIAVGFFLGKKIYEKSRDKRKNELKEDDYDYSLNH